MHKILFVDWDGVLNNFDLLTAVPSSFLSDFCAQERSDPLSPVCVGLLNRLCHDHPDVRIVCSSVWRKRGRQEVLNSLKEAHHRLVAATRIPQLPFSIRFFDADNESWRTRTGWEYDHPRGRAIDQWLQNYGRGQRQYLIIDDESDYYPWQKPFLIKIDGEQGFMLNAYEQVENMLRAFPAPLPQMRFDF